MKRLQHNWPALPLLTSAALLFVVFLFLAGRTNPLSLDDGLRHMRMAQIIRDQGIASVGGWGDSLYFGFFAETNTDPWFLSHIFTIPFTYLPLVTAQKAFVLASTALLLLSFLLVLRNRGVRPVTACILSALLLLGEPVFFGRLLVARPLLLMTAVTLLVLLSLFRRSWIALALLIAVAVLLSHLFVFPLWIALCGILWLLWMGERKNALRMFLASSGGVLMGLALHPSPLNYLAYMFTVFVRIPFSSHAAVSNEMQPGLTTGVMIYPAIGIVLLLIAYALLKKKIAPVQLLRSGIALTATISIVLLVLYVRWIRAIDFLWPCLLILLGQCSLLFANPLETLGELLTPRALWKTGFMTHIFYSVIFLLCFKHFVAMHTLYNTEYNLPITPYATAIRDIPPDARILNTEWYLYPIFYWLRPDLRYATGMDTAFTWIVAPEAEELLTMQHSDIFKLTSPLIDALRWKEQLLSHIPGDYLVLTYRDNTQLIAQLDALSSLKKTSGTGNTIAVFRILE